MANLNLYRSFYDVLRYGNIYINNQFSQEQNDCNTIKVLNIIRKI